MLTWRNIDQFFNNSLTFAFTDELHKKVERIISRCLKPVATLLGENLMFNLTMLISQNNLHDINFG